MPLGGKRLAKIWSVCPLLQIKYREATELRYNIDHVLNILYILQSLQQQEQIGETVVDDFF